MITPGRYRHYKGRDYQVLGCAKHTETEEELVVYQALYGDHGLWVRPTDMFEEEIEKEGVRQPRFQRLEDWSKSPEAPGEPDHDSCGHPPTIERRENRRSSN